MAIRLMSAASSTLLSGSRLKIAVPITMPRTIAKRMYCVNLFDILAPLTCFGRLSLADFDRRATCAGLFSGIANEVPADAEFAAHNLSK